MSLGAGFDTRYFLLKVCIKRGNDAKQWVGCSDELGLQAGNIPVSNANFKYFEIDFPEMISKKASIIRRRTELATMLNSPTVGMYEFM